MMKMTERLQDKQSMIRLIFHFHLGTKLVKREKNFARVNIIFFYKNILELLEKNRHKRPTLEEVLDHRWFADFKDI